jgi:hypothetical protein
MASMIIAGTPKRKQNYRREQFNSAVRALAPIIAAIRAEGVIGVEEIRDRLNLEGVMAPDGGKFSTGSTHRIVGRLAELNLGAGPRSVSQALRDIWDRRHKKEQETIESRIADQALRKKKAGGPV